MDECDPQRLREVINAAKVTQSKKLRGSYEEPCSLTYRKDIAYKSTAINKHIAIFVEAQRKDNTKISILVFLAH